MHDAGEFEGRQYLVTEFVDGGTLRAWIRDAGRDCLQVIELLTGVADGLASAHQAGILHRASTRKHSDHEERVCQAGGFWSGEAL